MIAAKINRIRIIFNLDLISLWVLNFNENKGILLINRNGIIIAIIISSFISVNIGNLLKSIWGIDAINIANAGVGSPINECFCLLSILKFAKRYAEKMGIKNAKDAGKKKLLFCIEWRNIISLSK